MHIPSAYVKLNDFFTIQSNVTPIMILLYNETNIRTVERRTTRVDRLTFIILEHAILCYLSYYDTNIFLNIIYVIFKCLFLLILGRRVHSNLLHL